MLNDQARKSARCVVVVGSAVLFAASVSMATGGQAQAATKQNGCSAAGITGYDKFNYWYDGNLVRTNAYWYSFNPATTGTQRYKNNVKINWSNGQSYASPDALYRDGTWHTVPNQPNSFGDINKFTVRFTNVYNTSAQPDPQCSWSATV